jgi:ATP sulfurylase
MPQQVRTIFEALGWAKVVGFHTRNVIHRSHEFIQLQALKKTGCDGLFVQPIVGTKKKGDFLAEIIIKSYEIMLEKYYEKNKVIFGLFSTYSRYAGPREAVFTALCRQNFGCSHFIIGRDHTGVKNYFGPKDSHNIFDKIGKIGITPVFFEEVGYDPKIRGYVIRPEVSKEDFVSISGTEIREMLQHKKMPPEWVMRKEIARHIIEKIGKGEKVFV